MPAGTGRPWPGLVVASVSFFGVGIGWRIFRGGLIGSGRRGPIFFVEIIAKKELVDTARVRVFVFSEFVPPLIIGGHYNRTFSKYN